MAAQARMRSRSRSPPRFPLPANPAPVDPPPPVPLQWQPLQWQPGQVMTAVFEIMFADSDDDSE